MNKPVDQQPGASDGKLLNHTLRLQRRSLADHIADKLRDLVLLEQLQPGAPIHERETAEALGVSRTPLREALRILASEGLVEIVPNKPPQVADPTLEELRELLTVQGALEALAGELACEHASDDELSAIAGQAQRLRRMSDNSEALGFFQDDMRFHESIVAASANTSLQTTHRMYNSRLWRARFISSRQRVNRDGTLEQHDRIVAALLAREPQQAALALREHLDSGYRNIKMVMLENSK